MTAAIRFVQTPITVLLITHHLLVEPVQCKRRERKTSSNTRKFLELPFDVCGESRLLNPVEAVRAHALATRLFVNCVRDIIVHYAQKGNVPAETLYPASKLGCLGVHVLYGYFSGNRGAHILDKSQQPGPMLTELSEMMKARKSLGNRIVVPLHNGTIYELNWLVFENVTTELASCTLRSVDGGPPHDGDYLIHTIKHVRYLLL